MRSIEVKTWMQFTNGIIYRWEIIDEVGKTPDDYRQLS
jgi:hypothetical protein